MDAIQPHSKPLALEPIDLSTAEGDAARPFGDGSSASAAGQRELGITIADEFLVAVAKEYQEGHVDTTLWAWAEAQSGDDNSLVIAAYLRARATALQLQNRDKRLERRARRAGSGQGTRKRKVETEPQSEILSADAAGVRLRGVQLKPGYLAAAAASLVSVVAVVWLLALPQESEPVRQASASAAAPSAKRSAPASTAASARGGTSQDDSVPTLEAVVQQLKDAGNWNVLVLYASKWTRDEPNNAAAWNELSIGYANLRQFNDAFGAATRAVELAPGDTRLWRNLGHLNLAMGRLPEAGSAFDRALTASADDADALCGALLVAHRLGRTKDADAIAGRVKSADGVCPGVSDGESVAVAAGGPAARRPLSSVRR